MDTNVVGRKYNDHQATELDEARVRRIFIRSLTEATHGNACGIGMAEFTTRRAAAQVDHKITNVNCITAGHPTAAMMPVVCENDRQAVEDGLSTIGLTPPEKARVIHIHDTLHLETVLISEAYASEIGSQPRLEVVAGPEPMAFDSGGFLVPLS
jgi:hypothetical protein